MSSRPLLPPQKPNRTRTSLHSVGHHPHCAPVMATGLLPAADIDLTNGRRSQNRQRTNGCGPQLPRLNGQRALRGRQRRSSPSRVAATGPLIDSLGAVRLLNDLPGRLFERPQLLFPRPETLFPESSLRDWVMDKELVLEQFEWEAVIAVSFILLVFAELASRWVPGTASSDAAQIVARIVVRSKPRPQVGVTEGLGRIEFGFMRSGVFGLHGVLCGSTSWGVLAEKWQFW